MSKYLVSVIITYHRLRTLEIEEDTEEEAEEQAVNQGWKEEIDPLSIVDVEAVEIEEI